MRYKKNQKVMLIETAYLHERYKHHGSEQVIVVSAVPKEEWQSSYIAEYRVKDATGDVFIVPVNSID